MSKVTKSKTERMKCGGECSRELVLSKFYQSNSPMFPSGKAPLCKDCIKKMINYNNIQSIYDILQSLDLPFIFDIWNKTVENNPKDIFGNYVRQINSLSQYKGMRYKDSIYEGVSNNKSNFREKKEASNELRMKWGKMYSYDQIQKLEQFSIEMSQNYKIETASHRDYLYKIAKVSLKMDECLDNDDVTGFAKYSSVYDNLMKSAKFTAVQRSAVDDTGGFATICEFIERLESDGFIKPEPITENFDIVEATIADMKRYTKQLVLGDGSVSTLAQETLIKMQQKQEESDGDTDE